MATNPPKGSPLDELLARAALDDGRAPLARAPTEAIARDEEIWSDFTHTEAGPDPTAIHSRYQIFETIGEGGSASVHRGRDRTTGLEVAVKLLHLEELESRHWRRRLISELEALRRLEHPNVLRVHDFGVTADRQPMIVFELIEGESLRDLSLRMGKVPADRVLVLAKQIASALAAIHAAGIVHRDIKLANLMLTKHGVLKIVDFGLVRFGSGELTRVTVAGALLGTPETIAPEQIVDAGAAGPPADMYAVGVCLFRLLEGAPPFVGPLERVLFQHAKSQIPPIAEHGGLGPLVRALLAKRPEKRPTAKALLAALDGAPLRSGEDGARLYVAVAAALVVLAGAGSFALLRAREPDPIPTLEAAAAIEISPRAVAAPEPEAVPPPELPPEVPPPPLKARPSARPSDGPTPEALLPGRLEAELRGRLDKVGLGLPDLEWLAPAAWSEARAARKSKDLARFDAASAKIRTAIARPIDDQAVRAALDHALAAIRSASLEAEQLGRLEDRYFELRRGITGARAATNTERIELIRQARSLERSISKRDDD